MTTLTGKAEIFVQELFSKKLPNTFIYHNFKHTQRVIKSTKELIEKSEIHVKQEEPLLLAAWLHDIGYTKTYVGHEEKSVEISEKWLHEHNADQELIKDVSRCIRATRMGVEP